MTQILCKHCCKPPPRNWGLLPAAEQAIIKSGFCSARCQRNYQGKPRTEKPKGYNPSKKEIKAACREMRRKKRREKPAYTIPIVSDPKGK